MDSRITVFNQEVDKVVDHLHKEYAKLQTGVANPALVENIEVDAYGQMQAIKALAGISVEEGRTIVVQPWDQSTLQAIEAALQKADLGMSPTSDGVAIRMVLPPMTEERRTEMVKLVSKIGEEAHISVRQLRQRVHDDVKDNEKDEDVRYTLIDSLQKEVDKANDRINETMKAKEKDVMTV